jgi:hypothetical protein
MEKTDLERQNGQEAAVQATLTQPDQIRRSRSDSNVYLFYKLQREKHGFVPLSDN